MSEELKNILDDTLRFGRINKEDIPKLIKLVKELEDSEKLAWAMVDKLENEMGAYR